jgi:co-chaperonin GroES (HSP10)
MNNVSGLKPLGRAVLLKHYEPERKVGMIVIPESHKDRQLMLEQRAIVVELGPHCWVDEPTPRAQPGDRVLVAKFEGCLAKGPADGQTYWFVNDRDIFAAITKENDNA